jgi:hypothetical protein
VRHGVASLDTIEDRRRLRCRLRWASTDETKHKTERDNGEEAMHHSAGAWGMARQRRAIAVLDATGQNMCCFVTAASDVNTVRSTLLCNSAGVILYPILRRARRPTLGAADPTVATSWVREPIE